MSRRQAHDVDKASPTEGAAIELAAPRFAGWWAALVYAAATMLLAYPALGGMFLINARSDQYIAGYVSALGREFPSLPA